MCKNQEKNLCRCHDFNWHTWLSNQHSCPSYLSASQNGCRAFSVHVYFTVKPSHIYQKSHSLCPILVFQPGRHTGVSRLHRYLAKINAINGWQREPTYRQTQRNYKLLELWYYAYLCHFLVSDVRHFIFIAQSVQCFSNPSLHNWNSI